MLNLDDVDTDRIIPARFLSRVSRSGYGELLFADARGDGFPLNAPDAQGASILVVGENFGCGSSREHAVWAIQQAGFKAVIAKRTADSLGFSDIFRQNAANCGLLLIELPQEQHDELVGFGSGAKVTIDLPSQTLTLPISEFRFEMAEANKQALLRGLDLIGTTLDHESDIARFEKEHPPFVPPKQ